MRTRRARLLCRRSQPPCRGGLPLRCRPPLSPAGRILSGKTGVGAEEVPERRSGVRQREEEAVLGTCTVSLCCGRILKAVRWLGSLWPPRGWARGLGSKLCRNQAKTKQAPSPPLPICTNQEPLSGKVTSFLSKKGLLKETTNCKLPSLLLLLFLDGYKDSVKSHT